MRTYYNGVAPGDMGHHLYDHTMTRVWGSRTPYGFPCRRTALDGAFLPRAPRQIEGLASLWHVQGWTILCFWDRSGDSRSNSNSAFVLEGHHNFDESVAIASTTFPQIWKRMTFEIEEAT